MRVEVRMGNLGYDMVTGKIVRWMKEVGETVSRGEPLVEVETDKTNIEMEALESGRVVELKHMVGDEVPVGEVIAVLESDV